MNPRISMISLGVLDLARSIEFYETGLGLPTLDSPPEVAFFPLNGSWLGLYSQRSMAAEAGVSFARALRSRLRILLPLHPMLRPRLK